MRKPLFEHRHFVFLADWLAHMSDHPTKQSCINTLAAALQYTNPGFNRERFERAANNEPGWRDRYR